MLNPDKAVMIPWRAMKRLAREAVPETGARQTVQGFRVTAREKAQAGRAETCNREVLLTSQKRRKKMEAVKIPAREAEACLRGLAPSQR